MLLLERKPGEKITLLLGDKVVTITYTSHRGRIIKLGFEADPSVIIYRSEMGPWLPDGPKKG